MTDKITLRRFDDMHCHFRTGLLLKTVLPYTVRYAGRALVMPNIRPNAILTGEDVVRYRDEIRQELDKLPGRWPFDPLLSIEIRDNTTADIVVGARRAGAAAGKAYPLGVTTNSAEGLRDFHSRAISKTFAAMQDTGMLLLIHGELDRERTLVTEREKIFLPTLVALAEKFPRLKIVFEHVSSRAAVDLVKKLGENVAATITVHHLCLTLNDVIGYGIQPHHVSMPIPKSFEDRNALIDAATSGNSKFFLGSDSAPHLREKKESAMGPSGVFTSPVLPEVLLEVFDKVGRLDRLEDFTSRFGAEFYGIPLNKGFLVFLRSEWTVPDEIEGVVPFRAGTKLGWKLL